LRLSIRDLIKMEILNFTRLMLISYYRSSATGVPMAAATVNVFSLIASVRMVIMRVGSERLPLPSARFAHIVLAPAVGPARPSAMVTGRNARAAPQRSWSACTMVV
jgi:hypothetical protein